MEGFEILSRLNQLLKDYTEDEKNIKIQSDPVYGDSLSKVKTRLNYLVTLGILRHPKAKQYGKGKGGTRFFQRDVLEVIEFLLKYKGQFSINELAEVVKVKREDLTRQYCKDFNMETNLQNPSIAIQACINFANQKCLFKEELLQANVLGTMISEINNHLSELKTEIAALDSFQNNIGKTFCNEDHQKMSNYVNQKENLKDDLVKILDGTIRTAKELIEKIVSEEY
jgi:DNA-binding transcriptional MerR regulator